jgi:hypothetical protein
MSIKEVSGKDVLTPGWPEFAFAHKLKIGYLLFFKKLTAKEYRVVVFDYSCCEVVGRCPEHPHSMRRLQADKERSNLSLSSNVSYMLSYGCVKNMVLLLVLTLELIL